MIDKDQVPIILAMIRTTYSPVILRAIINLVLVDMSQIQAGAGPNVSVNQLLASDKCRQALIKSLNQNHRPRKGDLIDEIIHQYGLHLNKDEQDFYHRQMGIIFENQLDWVISVVSKGDYNLLGRISQETMQ